MVRRTTSCRYLYYIRVVFTIFFFFVLTVNLYFILIKEMFIYSNHYLIISKLTQEDKDYFTHEPYEPYDTEYNAIDDIKKSVTDYHYYVDLCIYEFESKNFVIFKPDTLESEENTNYFFGEQNENVIDYYDNDKIISDQLHRSMFSEPFLSMYWSVPFTFYANIEASDEEKEIALKEFLVGQETSLNMNFEDEDLEKTFFFPTNDKFVFFLNSNTSKYIQGHNRCGDRFVEEVHHIIYQDYCLDLDAVELEYWNEPLFVFPLIREMHFHRDEKDFFSDLHTSPVNNEWFNTGEFDNSSERYS